MKHRRQYVICQNIYILNNNESEMKERIRTKRDQIPSASYGYHWKSSHPWKFCGMWVYLCEKTLARCVYLCLFHWPFHLSAAPHHEFYFMQPEAWGTYEEIAKRLIWECDHSSWWASQATFCILECISASRSIVLSTSIFMCHLLFNTFLWSSKEYKSIYKYIIKHGTYFHHGEVQILLNINNKLNNNKSNIIFKISPYKKIVKYYLNKKWFKNILIKNTYNIDNYYK